MSHLNRFYELKANNQDSLVSFDCLLADFEAAKTENQFFMLTVCSKSKILGNVIADDFGVLYTLSDNHYWLSFDGANFGAFEEEIAIDIANLEIVIVYGTEN